MNRASNTMNTEGMSIQYLLLTDEDEKRWAQTAYSETNSPNPTPLTVLCRLRLPAILP